MDPLTITTTCITLVSTIGKVSFQINTFVRQVRDSRQDLDAVSRELHSLETILNILADEGDEQEKQDALPTNLVAQIAGVLSNCGVVLVQIQASLKKHEGGGLRKGLKWTISGRDDMEKLRSSLEAHKSALGLTLDFATHLITREISANTRIVVSDKAVIRDDTFVIRGDTAVIIEENAQILSEIAKLQARLPVESQAFRSTGITLQRYLDNLTSYAESSCDTIAELKDWEKGYIPEEDEEDSVSGAETTPAFELSVLRRNTSNAIKETTNIFMKHSGHNESNQGSDQSHHGSSEPVVLYNNAPTTPNITSLQLSSGRTSSTSQKYPPTPSTRSKTESPPFRNHKPSRDNNHHINNNESRILKNQLASITSERDALATKASTLTANQAFLITEVNNLRNTIGCLKTEHIHKKKLITEQENVRASLEKQLRKLRPDRPCPSFQEAQGEEENDTETPLQQLVELLLEWTSEDLQEF